MSKISQSQEKALKIANFVFSKKAKDIVILDIKASSSLCDYFIICSGDSTRQVNTLYEEITKAFKKNEIFIHHSEKDEALRWILIDFFDVILHIFLDETRQFYNLEYLWSQAKKVRFK